LYAFCYDRVSSVQCVGGSWPACFSSRMVPIVCFATIVPVVFRGRIAVRMFLLLGWCRLHALLRSCQCFSAVGPGPARFSSGMVPIACFATIVPVVFRGRIAVRMFLLPWMVSIVRFAAIVPVLFCCRARARTFLFWDGADCMLCFYRARIMEWVALSSGTVAPHDTRPACQRWSAPRCSARQGLWHAPSLLDGLDCWSISPWFHN